MGTQPNFNTPPVGVVICTNDPVANNKPVLARLSDCEVVGSKSSSLSSGTILSDIATGTQRHGSHE